MTHTGTIDRRLIAPALIARADKAIRKAAGKDTWTSLTAIREATARHLRPAVDAALEDLASTPGVHIQAEANQQALTDADRAAAVTFGGSTRHLIKIER